MIAATNAKQVREIRRLRKEGWSLSELSEALEKHRKTIGKGQPDQPDEHCPEFGGVEFADVVIRLMDLCQKMNINLAGGNSRQDEVQRNAADETRKGVLMLKPVTKEAYQLLMEGQICFSRIEAAGLRIDVPYLDSAIHEIRNQIIDMQNALKTAKEYKVWAKSKLGSASRTL